MTRRRNGKVSTALGVGAGVLAIALGVGLVLEAGSAFGRAWAAVFIVFGVVSAIGAIASSRPLDPGSPQTRLTGVVVLLLLAGWAAATAVVGVLDESWLWGVLLGIPAAALLWVAARTWRHDRESVSPRP